ncbi:MAG: MarR family winged helix-turn-helix transcriptional regulator [Actinomycetota bacterium]|nr:MarR family winged helix-turn-helix transcriptional regulator [Actinomycetota bacterium]
MSKQANSGPALTREPHDVLGYLLKHAHLALETRTDAALAPFGITSRDLGALRVIAGGVARSQQDVAAILGVDRTSMVALLDALERAGIVARRPSEHDRRRNVIGLTTRGAEVFAQAEQSSLAVERDFAGILGDHGASELRRELQALIGSPATAM